MKKKGLEDQIEIVFNVDNFYSIDIVLDIQQFKTHIQQHQTSTLVNYKIFYLLLLVKIHYNFKMITLLLVKTFKEVQKLVVEH